MKIKTATTIFEVLASEVRLSIFRLLVKYAPEGLVAGEISQMLDSPNVVPAILPTASRTWRKAVSNRNFYRFIAKNKRMTRR